LNSPGSQGGGDALGVGVVVVISQRREDTLAGTELASGLSGGFGGIGALFGVVQVIAKEGNGYEVAGEDDKVGLEIVDDLNGSAEGNRGKNLVVVQVAELRDGKSVERRRQAGEGKVEAHELRIIGLEEDSVGRQSQRPRAPDRGRGLKEASSVPLM